MSRCARVLSSILAFSLVLPPALAQAQEPVSPPPPPPADGTSPAPVAADPQPATPSPSPEPLNSGDEYETLRRTLPNDYDINYTFTDDARRRKRDNDPGHAAKSASRMGIAGGTLTLVGLIGAITTVTTGLVIAKKAEDDFEDLKADDALSGMPDYEKRAELLKKGENGDLTAIIGGAISGAALAVGIGLLFGARSMRKRTYGPTDPGVTPTKPGGRQPLAAKTRTNLAIYGTLLGLYGVIAIAAGAVLVGKDDDKKKRNGTILLASGGVMAAIAVPMFIVLAIDKSRRNTARLNFGPTYVRGGGGGFVSLRF